MRHTGIVIALLSSAAIVATVSAGSAWPAMTKSPVLADHIVLAQMGGMGGGGMGGGGMGGGGMGGGGMGGSVNVNRNVNVHVRGVRPWSRRAWYGTAIAGVTLGTIIAVTAAPPPPRDNLCWFWVDASLTRGYWDWCIPPN